MSKVEQILDAIGSLTIIEAAELKKLMEEKFGVTAAAPIAVAAAVSGAAAEAVEEKDEFDVVLAEKKIQVIKALREVTSLGLKEAKDLVDGAPSTVKEGASKEEAQQIKAKLEEQGAKVELR
jgi:large subunit ribosomal protein L7/L12